MLRKEMKNHENIIKRKLNENPLCTIDINLTQNSELLENVCKGLSLRQKN